jgi:16S rRNA G527 N7-methylase RsmG
VALTERQIEQFWLYHGLLRHHNTELNLTRIHNFAQMVLKLYVDSALPARLTTCRRP